MEQNTTCSNTSNKARCLWVRWTVLQSGYTTRICVLDNRHASLKTCPMALKILKIYNDDKFALSLSFTNVGRLPRTRNNNLISLTTIHRFIIWWKRSRAAAWLLRNGPMANLGTMRVTYLKIVEWIHRENKWSLRLPKVKHEVEGGYTVGDDNRELFWIHPSHWLGVVKRA
jgi:hypothetical protein